MADASMSETEDLGAFRPASRASIPSRPSAEGVDHLLRALRVIAGEQKIGDPNGPAFIVIPNLTGYEAQSVARAALSRAGVSRNG